MSGERAMGLGKGGMASLKKRLGIAKIARREVRGLLSLGPWVLISLVLVALLSGADLAATAGLFQSPPPTEPATEVPTATEEVIPPTPTEAPVVVETATDFPTSTTVPTETPVPTVPTELSPTPTATPTMALIEATVTPAPSATPTPEQDPDRYAEGESELTFDWAMLVDSAALAFTYVWLCCGVLVLLSIPVLFLVLWAASKRRQQSGE